MPPALDAAEVDFFTDEAVAQDPLSYYQAVREHGSVWQEPHHGVLVVSGHAEVVEVLSDAGRFSNCNAVSGPFPGMPFTPEGDDIGAQIEEHRPALMMNEHLVTMDPPDHAKHRSLLQRLLTPRRLKENEDFMWRLADQHLDRVLQQRRAEFFHGFAQPYAMSVVADLLGVPEKDHVHFGKALLSGSLPGAIGDEDAGYTSDTLTFLDDYFAKYVAERRRDPQQDVLTALATTPFPDGSTPEVVDVVRVATFLFAAGQDTSAKLMTFAVWLLSEDPELQDRLRRDPEPIPAVIEEMLRLESPVKADFRLARKTTTVGGVPVKAGTTLCLLLGAANRDPQQFEDPDTFRLDRRDSYAHVTFGRGSHACPGGALARAEGRVMLTRLLERTKSFRLSDEHHGPASERRFSYDPTYILRGLTKLHVEFEPAGSSATTMEMST